MENPWNKTPFSFLLVPLLAGILLQYYGENMLYNIIAFLVGGTIMLLTFVVNRARSYSLRWVFGLSVFLLFLALGGFATYVQQQSLTYEISKTEQTYRGYVSQTPQEKPRSVAHKVYLTAEKVNVVCYIEKDTSKSSLSVGDEIVFQAQLQPFKNAGNPNDFDYVEYMYNQGFVASAYLSSGSWIKTGKSQVSLKIRALQVRQQIIDFYTRLGFAEEEKDILAALTLGYQDTLSDDLKQGFRATGTVHVLSVSGLHVGIIYGIIVFLLSFIPRHSSYYRVKPLLIILLLWVYAFITGLPASVIRASVMLSVFCLSQLFIRKNNPLNTLFFAAFVMLIYNPFWLFDIGFQLSFISVLSILLLYKRMSQLWKIKNKVLRKIWELLCLSTVAQLATFPICLYYFGTFPTYFFLANLIIVPLVGLIIYGVGIIVALSFISSSATSYAVYVLQQMVGAMNGTVNFIQKFPLALIEHVEISFAQFLLIVAILVSFLIAGIQNRAKSLIVALSMLCMLIVSEIINYTEEKDNQLVIYNRYNDSEIVKREKGQCYFYNILLETEKNPILELGDKKLLILNEIPHASLSVKEKYSVDFILIVDNKCKSISQIEKYYNSSFFILDSSTTPYLRKRLTKECENRAISLYDVSNDGAFSIIF